MSKFTCTLADLAFTLYARYPATERFCRDYLASGDGIAIAYSASEMAAECETTGMRRTTASVSSVFAPSVRFLR